MTKAKWKAPMILGIPKPVILTYAANGPVRSKLDYLGIPIKREELVAAAKEANASGAAIFSLCVRDAKGQPTIDQGLYAEAVNAIREETAGAILIQLELDTCSGLSTNVFSDLVTCAAPDLVQVRFDQMLPRDGDDSDEKIAQSFFETCLERRVGVQLAMLQPSDIDWYYAFRQYGVIPEAITSLCFVMGEEGEEKSGKPHDLRAFLANLDKQHLLGSVLWSVSCFGPEERACLAAAIAFGGHASPGFAFNIHNIDGEAFASLSDQQKPFSELAETLGRPTASAFEAKTMILGAL